MTRVEDDRAQQRYDEQKRIEKQSQTRNAQGAEQFKKIVNTKQDGTLKVARRQEATGNMGKQQQSQSKKGQAQARLMGKSGIQSRDLQAELMKRSDQAAEHHATERHDDLDMLKHQDNKFDQQTTQANDDAKHVQTEADKLAAIAGDEKRKGSENESSQGGDMGGGQMGMPMGTHQPQTNNTQEAKGNAGGARIPETALRALVKLAQVRINTKGMSEFSIELRDDVLAGSKMNISADGRKISATFVSDDANIRRLFKASEGDLARAFDNAGLSLDNFKVSAF